MDFNQTKQEKLFLQMIREFAEKEIKPLAAEIDEEERFPVESVSKMGKLGIMGIPFPTEYGGAGGPQAGGEHQRLGVRGERRIRPRYDGPRRPQVPARAEPDRELSLHYITAALRKRVQNSGKAPRLHASQLHVPAG